MKETSLSVRASSQKKKKDKKSSGWDKQTGSALPSLFFANLYLISKRSSIREAPHEVKLLIIFRNIPLLSLRGKMCQTQQTQPFPNRQIPSDHLVGLKFQPRVLTFPCYDTTLAQIFWSLRGFKNWLKPVSDLCHVNCPSCSMR